MFLQSHRRRDDPGELPALEEFAAFSAATGDLVLRGADRLLGPASGFDRQQIAVALRRDEPQEAIFAGLQLDEDDAATWPAEEVDLLDLAQHRARLAGGGD